MTSGFLGAVKRRGKPGMLVVGCWLFGAGSLHLPRSEFRVPDSVPPPGSDQGWVVIPRSSFQVQGSMLVVDCWLLIVGYIAPPSREGPGMGHSAPHLRGSRFEVQGLVFGVGS